ncbi:MAG TPA: polysaccharide biosynthesis C-terminal domain-containing protein, partial [Flavisolibacter sp.]|nr:polysaccharide biosynthesis C-terminal domain-containing protein [Flavisolibacter sp.]
TLSAAFVFYQKKTRFLAYLAVLNVVLNIALNYILIKSFGGIGAAYATALSYFFVALVITWKVVREFDMPWLYFLSHKVKKVA